MDYVMIPSAVEKLIEKWRLLAAPRPIGSLNGIQQLTLLGCADALEAALREEGQAGVSADALAEHWLSQMDCDHNMKRDRAVCSCGFVTIWSLRSETLRRHGLNTPS